jgi:hypothetical protein
MADGDRGREVAGVKRIGYKREGYRARGQSGCLINELIAVGVLDPEFALVGADAVDCAFVELAALDVAGFIDRKLDGR